MKKQSTPIQRWRRWYKRIEHELYALCTRRAVYERTAEIVRANPAIDRPGEFLDLIVSGYATYMTMGLRRLCQKQDKNPRRKIVSLRALLQEIHEMPTALTRYRVRYNRGRARGGPPAAHDQLVNQRELDAMPWMGPSHVCPDKVMGEIIRLDSLFAPWDTYVNKHMAHNDWRNLRRSRTFPELNRLLDFVVDIALTCKLHLEDAILAGSGRPYEASLLEDWEAVLRIPWLPDEESVI